LEGFLVSHGAGGRISDSETIVLEVEGDGDLAGAGGRMEGELDSVVDEFAEADFPRNAGK